jgi:two-component system, cell cycle response regulator DivK
MSKLVLIVEDYQDARTFMKYLLESYGYEVEEAADGKEAVEMIRNHVPDLVLMDISMPVMDGLTATRIIRGSQSKSAVPIIALTAHGQAYYRKALDAGCNDLINKPVDFESFQPMLKRYLH